MSWSLEREKVGKGMFKKWLGIIFVSLIICLVRKYVLFWNENHSPFFFKCSLNQMCIMHCLETIKFSGDNFFFSHPFVKYWLKLPSFLTVINAAQDVANVSLYILHQIVSYLYLCMFKCIYLLHHNDFIIKELFLCCDFWIY